MKPNRLLRLALPAILWLPSLRAVADDFPLPEQLCSAELNFRDGDREFHVPYCRNLALSSVNDNVRRAIIAIPGSESPAKMYYETVKRLAEEEGMAGEVSIIVPNFLEDDGSGGSVLQTLNLTDDYMYWSPMWRYGNRAANGTKISSFEVVDMIVRNLLANNKNLKHIALVGHSAGARLVNRYATASTVPDTAAAKGVTMSFGVFAPGAVVYLNDTRPYPTTGCSGFKNYPDGIQKLSEHNYMRNTNAADMRTRIFNRHIYYTVGENDKELFTEACDKVQGIHRLDLQRKYMAHLSQVCRDSFAPSPDAGLRCSKLFFKKIDVIGELPGVSHSHMQEWQTARGRNILFHWN